MSPVRLTCFVWHAFHRAADSGTLHIRSGKRRHVVLTEARMTFFHRPVSLDSTVSPEVCDRCSSLHSRA
jgi:hypothetical protein